MNTIRELIIQQFVARAAVMRTSSPWSGYGTNIGATVLRERGKIDPSDLPCTVIWPQTETSEKTHGAEKLQMVMQVDGMAKFGSSDPSVMSEQILGDLRKAFTAPGWFEGPPKYIEAVAYQSGGKSQAMDDGALAVGMAARFVVTYWTQTGDPYTQ